MNGSYCMVQYWILHISNNHIKWSLVSTLAPISKKNLSENNILNTFWICLSDISKKFFGYVVTLCLLNKKVSVIIFVCLIREDVFSDFIHQWMLSTFFLQNCFISSAVCLELDLRSYDNGATSCHGTNHKMLEY